MAHQCWNCQRETSDVHFCPHCGKIQAPEAPDYFAFLGFPRSLKMKSEELEKRFHDLSRKFHPDYFFRSSDRERALSMEQSSRLNDAYRTLRNPVQRAQYLLSLYGMRPDIKGQQAPPDLLEEALELREEIANLQAARNSGDLSELDRATRTLQQIANNLNRRKNALDAELDRVSEKWEQARPVEEREGAAAPQAREALAALRQNLSKRSYIENLIRKIEDEAA